MTIPLITNWSPKALLLGSAAVIGGFVGSVTGVDALAEAQPFATKNMLIAQNEAFAETIATLRLDNLVDRIDTLQYQLDQKRFQRIQLNELMKVDPDEYKQAAYERLNASIDQDEKRLERMRCQFEYRGQDTERC